MAPPARPRFSRLEQGWTKPQPLKSDLNCDMRKLRHASLLVLLYEYTRCLSSEAMESAPTEKATE